MRPLRQLKYCGRERRMYLKSIEIQGFKSFAHKTVLHFNEGVTAIVGPNGSGKSNIADAVRWVLGEQKVRQLRGSSMQDVIFAGTKLRKAQGFAYVCIVLDNTDHVLPVDYEEVAVSRRLFRSGESEYMLNGQNVRLRDIQELFYDTGIGREGYSIIGQGQIDAILSGKPEDRRGLFDEAAGIIKYKRKKAEAVKRLESERENLVRISDILQELSRRVGPLERQSASAREYLKLREQLKTYDLNLFLRETESILDALEKADEGLKLTQGALQDVKDEENRLRSANEDLARELASSEEELNRSREERSKAQLLLQNLENQIQAAEKDIETDKETVRLQEEGLASLDREESREQETLFKYLASLDELSEHIDLIEERRRESGIGEAEIASEDTENRRELLERLRGFRERLIAISGMSAEELAAAAGSSAAGEAGSAETASGKAAGKAAGAEGGAEAEDDEEYSFEEPEWLKAIKNKRDELSVIREKEGRLNAWLEEAGAQYNVLTQQEKELSGSISEMKSRLAVLRSRLETQRNLAERYEGYGQSVRSVMQMKGRVKGIHGAVADLIRTEQRYETAVETALGSRIQNIVTDTESTAQQLIEYLKKNKLGRATFLPVDAVSYRPQPEYQSAMKEAGVIGLVSDVVETAAPYREMMNALLGNVLLVDGMQHAFAIQGRHHHGLRIVTLEGELLSPGGAVSGGSYKNASNLIGRTREMEELKEKEGELRKQYADEEEKLRQLQEQIREKTAELEGLNDELKELSGEKNSLSFHIISELKVQYAGILQKADFVAENIERLENETERLKESRLEASKRRQEALEHISERERFIEERREDVRHITRGEEEAAERIGALEQKRAELAGSQQDYFTRRDEISRDILELEKDLIRMENQKEKEQQKLDSRTEYIWNEYELSRSSARAFLDPTLGSDSSLRRSISEIKNQIKALGPINVQAIEEYKEVSERYELMKTQHADLKASEEAVLGSIRELDEGMKEQFSKHFALIQESFARVFAELFGGGEGRLELVMPEDPEADELEAGIAINVQPPGKKLQNMMQLSGGEKALTAIALLFAIQDLKPSPFCLLDEIEAALDDSNVVRFSNYLHRLTDRTQYIVITHRRGTMETADRLYGVTMQEKGVTALVSVDLVSDTLEN